MPETPQSLNAEHVTLNAERNYPLVALPHRRFTFSEINTKWEGDYPRQVTSQTRNAERFNGKAESSRTRYVLPAQSHHQNPHFQIQYPCSGVPSHHRLAMGWHIHQSEPTGHGPAGYHWSNASRPVLTVFSRSTHRLRAGIYARRLPDYTSYPIPSPDK